MALELATKDDLRVFELNILRTLKEIFHEKSGEGSKKWLKTKELEELYGISQGKQQLMRNKGEIPFSRIGDTIYYSLQDIDKILEANKTS